MLQALHLNLLAWTLAAAAPAPRAAPGRTAAPSAARLALQRGDLDAALHLARSKAEAAYVEARVALARFDWGTAEAALARLPAGHDRAEVSWLLARGRGADAPALARAAKQLCHAGDPTGRACVDAELYAQGVPPQAVHLGHAAQLPMAPGAEIPIVRAVVGGKTLDFVIDTGASESAISSAVARELDLEVTRGSFPVGVTGGGAVAQAHRAVLPYWVGAGVAVENLPVLVMDMPELDREGIGGVISPQQAFRGLVVSYDFGRHVLELRRDAPPAPAGRSTTVPYLSAGQDLAVAAQVGRGEKALFGLDTGMSESCVLADDYLPSAAASGTEVLHGAGPRVVARSLHALPVKLGDAVLPAAGNCLRSPMRKHGIRLEGLLGDGLWPRGVVTLDTARHLLTITLPDREASD